MGRPPKPIDAEQVRNLAKIGCTYAEIAAVVGCAKSTLSDRFRTEIDKGHEELKMSIRRLQLQTASKGNVAMLIWLGKQYLGQRDKQDVKTTDETELKIAERIISQRIPEPVAQRMAGNGNGNGNGNGRTHGGNDAAPGAG